VTQKRVEEAVEVVYKSAGVQHPVGELATTEQWQHHQQYMLMLLLAAPQHY